MAAVEVRGLTKTFGSKGKQVRALDALDLEVSAGTVLGLLGPNGAGKTTAVRVLTTLLQPDAGEARVLGHDVTAEPALVRRLIGLSGQYSAVDENLTGRENLWMFGRLYGLDSKSSSARAEELLEMFDLTEARDRVTKTYSGGMKRRLDLAGSLIAHPKVLFLDEPTTGLDPNARQSVWRMIRGLADSGVTILLTTQYLEEADQLAARIAVIDHGKKIAEGTSRELKAATGSGFLHIALADPAAQIEQAAAILERQLGHAVQRSTESADLCIPAGTAKAANEALAALIAGGIELSDFSLGQPSLDEVFFALTGRPGSGESQ
ncbi:MAG TPA: ATP-binding cassette domain-containing protein, partial [Nocardioidaceae bacterium]|nr:ATP-binding cassette domain-containing protein [Nocardioidaceae bacterium]